MPANDRKYRQILAAIVLCGFVLRVWGITFGLPLKSNLYIRPDESLIVAAAARFWETGGHPGFFAYPALMVEICAILYLPWTIFGDGAAVAFGRDPSWFFLVPRALSVVAATGSIPLVFVLTRRIASPTAALIAAALLALSPLAVRDAHFGVTDSLLVFLLLAAFAWPLQENRLRDIAMTGALFGLACSTKYTAILLAPAVAVRILLQTAHNAKLVMRNLVLAGACCTLVFVLLNPYVFLQKSDSAGQVYELLNVFYRTQPGDTQWSAKHAALQVLRPLRYGPGGWVGSALAAAGALMLAIRRMGLPVVVGAAAFISALLPFQHTLPYRYTLPVLPFLAILAACAMDRFKKRSWKTAFAALVIVPSAWESACIVHILSRADTRSMAGTWIEENVPQDTPILIFGPPECEPQIVESAASIQRRIDFAYRAYGPVSGAIVSQPYHMMKVTAAAGREVFRGVLLDQVPGSKALVVTPASPLPLVGAVQAHDLGGRVVKSATFVSLEGARPWIFDEIDAFFLPFHPMESVIRPGPTLYLSLVERNCKDHCK